MMPGLESTKPQNKTRYLPGTTNAVFAQWRHLTKQACMKRIEAVIPRSALDDFQRCAKHLGIFGFDLSEQNARSCNHQRREFRAQVTPVGVSKLKVDFVILDDDIKPTIHAVLESVHPESIAIFTIDRVPPPPTSDLLANRA